MNYKYTSMYVSSDSTETYVNWLLSMAVSVSGDDTGTILKRYSYVEDIIGLTDYLEEMLDARDDDERIDVEDVTFEDDNIYHEVELWKDYVNGTYVIHATYHIHGWEPTKTAHSIPFEVFEEAVEQYLRRKR